MGLVTYRFTGYRGKRMLLLLLRRPSVPHIAEHGTIAAASAYQSFGTNNNYAWLGTPNNNNAYYVNSNGNVNNNNTNNSYVCAPAFPRARPCGAGEREKVSVFRFP